MDRPYLKASARELLHLLESHWDNFGQVGLLAYEVQFRRSLDKNLKALFIERLVEIGLARGLDGTPSSPDFDFPTTDVQASRRAMRADLGGVSWREKGLLAMSGYRVGRTHGEALDKRRRLLNYILLRDDLQDVEDRQYAAEWGRPSTAERLRKLAETLAAFARNAKRNPSDMSQAIDEWEVDLEYLRTRFYERWNEFPWPDVDIL